MEVKKTNERFCPYEEEDHRDKVYGPAEHRYIHKLVIYEALLIKRHKLVIIFEFQISFVKSEKPNIKKVKMNY